MMTRVLLWLLAAMAGGIVLVLWGLRGKRINDHPVCRQCRFDLSGSPEGVITCPECGAGLKRPGSTRIGQRRKRPIAVVIGLAAIALPLAAISVPGLALVTGSDVHKYMPLGVLLWESRYADAARSRAIAAELKARYAAKKFDEGQVARVVACALDVQADTRIPWCPEWGDLIEDARSDGKVSDADHLRFRNQAPVLEFKVRPRAAAGGPLPVIVSLKEARIASASAFQSQVLLKRAALDGKPLKQSVTAASRGMFGHGFIGPMIGWLQMYGPSNRFGWGGRGSFGEAKILVDVPEGTPPGRHEVSIELQIKTDIQSNRMSFSWSSGQEFPNDPDARLHSRTLSVQIAPDGESQIELVQPQEDVRQKMRKALDTTSIHLWSYSGGGFRQPNMAMMQFNIDGRPMEGAFDVFWKTNGREHPVGQLVTGSSADPEIQSTSFGPGADSQRYVQGQIGNFEGGTVDVVLRPSAEAARRTTDLTRIYGEEIVFKDVEVAKETQQVYTSTTIGANGTDKSVFGALKKLFGGK